MTRVMVPKETLHSEERKRRPLGMEAEVKLLK
jgi:hypothetical protein